jgi:hypothetical protein
VLNPVLAPPSALRPNSTDRSTPGGGCAFLAIAAYRVGCFPAPRSPYPHGDAQRIFPASTAGTGCRPGSRFFLSVHFATWIVPWGTLRASSVVHVETIPLWGEIMTPLVTWEIPVRRTIAGIALSITGGILIGAGDFALGASPPRRRLALAGGFSGALYHHAGA